jgi:excinuclease ABC subunit A
VEFINQSPIGKSSRSNPVTYVKAYDYIRDLFAGQQLSKIRGFQPKHFSFNVEGGRCEDLQRRRRTGGGNAVPGRCAPRMRGVQGPPVPQEVLDVQYKGKTIFDVLNLSIEEALEFFKGNKDITTASGRCSMWAWAMYNSVNRVSTLSGGEAQRVKLALS